MKLQTKIPLSKAEHPIDYQGQVLLLGSCFSENIGEKLDYFKFRTLRNPFGILFHPKAIENLVRRAIQKDYYLENEVFFHNERWHCFDAHSDLSDVSRENLIQRLNRSLQATREQIQKASHIILTLGTAWTYRHIKIGHIVANCHKVPQSEFSKELLSVEDILNSLNYIVDIIGTVNQHADIVFTVSPVRHLKDGFVENQRSKAHLISALYRIIEISKILNPKSYFESYELMMDELRDYRFYADDMVHPNALAIDYIWERFTEVWISDTAFPTMEKIDTIQKGLLHRPFNPESGQHRQFVGSLQEKIDFLQRQHPFMVFGK
ncbi:GSCFA domain-containing protein [Flavobacteriaceae bacterium F89]|uniref:GSCFA domain-containing protein n=1 Tax=Cerina litoralis TaxID=2874477 RepID=A0AAE3ESS9_9FLAO|nr:GSCFA domain-containing protein [Cerina litoralis]MCG2459798.1 GSCFA domain-containing protein [Cerina litoralis]